MDLCVFYVQYGYMHHMDLGFTFKSISSLKEGIEKELNIPKDKQILLTKQLMHIDDEEKVQNLRAGKESDPIYIFNKELDETISISDLKCHYTFNRFLSILPKDYQAFLSKKLPKRKDLNDDYFEQQILNDHFQRQGLNLAFQDLRSYIIEVKKKINSIEAIFSKFLKKKEHFLSLNIDVDLLLENIRQLPMFDFLNTDSSNLLEFIFQQIVDVREISFKTQLEACLKALIDFDEHIFTQIINKCQEHVASAVEVENRYSRITMDYSEELQNCCNETIKIFEIIEEIQKIDVTLNSYCDETIRNELLKKRSFILIALQELQSPYDRMVNKLLQSKIYICNQANDSIKSIICAQTALKNTLSLLIDVYKHVKTLELDMNQFLNIFNFPSSYLECIREIYFRHCFAQNSFKWLKKLGKQIEIQVQSETVLLDTKFQKENSIISFLFPPISELSTQSKIKDILGFGLSCSDVEKLTSFFGIISKDTDLHSSDSFFSCLSENESLPENNSELSIRSSGILCNTYSTYEIVPIEHSFLDVRLQKFLCPNSEKNETGTKDEPIKVAVNSFKIGDFVLIYQDKSRCDLGNKVYRVLLLNKNDLAFLDEEDQKIIKFEDENRLIFVQVSDKCLKTIAEEPNYYKLPVNTNFYTIKVIPPNEALSF